MSNKSKSRKAWADDILCFERNSIPKPYKKGVLRCNDGKFKIWLEKRPSKRAMKRFMSKLPPVQYVIECIGQNSRSTVQS